MKTITLTLTDAEATLLDAQVKATPSMPMSMLGQTQVTDFDSEVQGYVKNRLAQARELAKRKVTEPMTDEQLAEAVK